MIINEKCAQEILVNRRIERDMLEPRTCAAIVIDLAMDDIDMAFDAMEAIRDSDKV